MFVWIYEFLLSRWLNDDDDDREEKIRNEYENESMAREYDRITRGIDE